MYRKAYMDKWRAKNKEKWAEYNRRWREKMWHRYYDENKVRILEGQQAWRQTDKGKECMRNSMAKRLKISPEKHKARAMAKSMIEKKPCEVCGTSENINRHHDDYSKPLEVRHLCFKHHLEVHGKEMVL